VKPIVDATLLAVAQRAHRRAVAEVGDHHRAAGALADHFRQLARDVVVGQAVEAVALDALGRQPARQREGLRDRRLGAVEGGVEAAHLRHLRHQRGDRAHRAQVVRLVQRGERHEGVERAQHRLVEPGRRAVVLAAMHDAVAGGDDVERRVVADEQREDVLERVAMLLALAAAGGHRLVDAFAAAVLKVTSGVAPMPSTWPDTAGAAATSPSTG
jgi:hypothetical protein